MYLLDQFPWFLSILTQSHSLYLLCINAWPFHLLFHSYFFFFFFWENILTSFELLHLWNSSYSVCAQLDCTINLSQILMKWKFVRLQKLLMKPTKRPTYSILYIDYYKIFFLSFIFLSKYEIWLYLCMELFILPKRK